MTDQTQPHILATLHSEHMATLAQLEELEALLRKYGSNSPPASDDTDANAFLIKLTVMLSEEITHHYTFEEIHLFPLFGDYFDQGIPMMLKGEHDAIRPLAVKAAELAHEAQPGGFSPESWKVFHGLATEIIEREVFHVQKEEMGFLPVLNQIMNPELEQNLRQAYARIKAG